MKPDTITKNEAVYLPKWARAYANIVALAERDLAFRCEVWSAKTAQMRNLLKREAARLNK